MPQLTVFYDGHCFLCRTEIEFLQRRTGEAVRYIDFQTEFSPEWGLSHEELMKEIHAVDERGNHLIGVEVFRRVYTYAGFGLLIAPTRWWGIRSLLDWAYARFAKNRLPLSSFFGRHFCKDGTCYR